MPKAEIFQIIIVIAFIVLAFLGTSVVYGERKKKLQLVADILCGEIKSAFLGYQVFGYYKNRKMQFRFTSYGQASYKMAAIITPQDINEQNRQFKIISPKPTENTKLRNGKIYWEKINASLIDISKEEIIALFDELTHAAEVVETSATYYKK